MHAAPVLRGRPSSDTSVDCMIRVATHVGEVLRDQRVAEVDEDVQVRREGVDDGRDAQGGEVRQLRRWPVADVELDVRLGPDDRDVDPAEALPPVKRTHLAVLQKWCTHCVNMTGTAAQHHPMRLGFHMGLAATAIRRA